MGLFDRFQDPEKVRARDEAKEAARVEENERRRREETTARIREEELIARAEWTYREVHDEMREITTSFAELRSENQIDLPFPYQGGSQMTICIRKSGINKEVLLFTMPAQYDRDLNGYTISIKADKGSVQTWTANEPSDGSSEIMFLNNTTRFIDVISRAERFIIEASFYGHGRGQFQFNPAGLDRRFR